MYVVCVDCFHLTKMGVVSPHSAHGTKSASSFTFPPVVYRTASIVACPQTVMASLAVAGRGEGMGMYALFWKGCFILLVHAH
jgi:hypothetical protein